MSQLGEALTDPALDPPVKALVCWNSNPASIAPDQERVLAGLRREDLFTVVLEQFMTDTAAHADVVLPATTQLEHLDVVFSWGHHYLTWNEPAIEPLRRGEAEHGDVPAAGGAARPRRSVLPRERRGARRAAARRASRRTACASAAGRRSTSARARPRTPRAASGRESGRATLHARYEPPAEVADAALAERFPLALVTPKTHLFLNSTFANQRAPALGAAGARGGREPRGRRGARHRGRRDACGSSTTAARSPARRACRTTRAPACSWRRWAGGTATTRAAAAPGHDLAAAHGRGQRADLQRQPRRARALSLTVSPYGSARSPASRAGCGRPPRRAGARGIRAARTARSTAT